MKKSQRDADDPNLSEIEVSPPKTWAAGIPGVAVSMQHALREMGPRRSLKTLSAMNQKDGFDCMSCAWPDPPNRKVAEFCENGAKAVAWEADPLLISSDFWTEHSVTDLADRSEYWLGQQGRLNEPVYKSADSEHYRPISWGAAFGIIARELNGLDSPDGATFYTSGRASNEAAYAYGLFARAFGTNNLPDCSNMCHESTGVAMADSIGVGKSTVSYNDFALADLIIIMGQNPGTNHPRMLTALEEAKDAGASIVAINPLPEAGLMRFKNPQRPSGIVGSGTQLADQFLQIRLGGDLALMQAVCKRVLEAEDATGDALDHKFLDEYCSGFDEFAAHIRQLDEDEVLTATGLQRHEIDELADRYLKADKVIVTWAMGLTQHRKAVDTIREILNLPLLRGNIGKPGAGASPIRGHSNVQGDRTMGIWEQMPDSFLDAIQGEFGFDPPRHHGFDVVESIRRMRDGEVKVLFALGGNFVSAVSDTAAAESAIRNTALSVQVSTKLNRSHGVVGKQALILPTLGRTEVDLQAGGAQFVTVEDTVCAVHASHGAVPPVADNLLSEVAIVSRLAAATLGTKVSVDWDGFERDYDTIRAHIARTIPGCEDYNEKVRRTGGFVLPHPPRDERRFPTVNGTAQLTVNHLEPIEVPAGRLILQTIRSHDQFNTTIYGLNDRYRGIHRGRQVVFISPEDLAELGFADGDVVDLHSEWVDGVDRVIRDFRIVSFPTARGCAAAYFPEANGLVPLDSVADRSNTPTSKAVILRLERAAGASS
ncbi:MAG: FdhF/YdeP family oxidoreductase [Antricoccus sp.]